MRIADVDFILIPEWLSTATAAPDANHWISRWQRNLATAHWLETSSRTPADALLAQADAGKRPIVIVTHGSGVDVILEVAEQLGARPVIGAFIVAPAPKTLSQRHNCVPAERPAFQSVVVASNNHPEFAPSEARRLADRMGGHFVAAGDIGRIDAASGQGPWPEGLMRLGWFLKQLAKH